MQLTHANPYAPHRTAYRTAYRISHRISHIAYRTAYRISHTNAAESLSSIIRRPATVQYSTVPLALSTLRVCYGSCALARLRQLASCEQCTICNTRTREYRLATMRALLCVCVRRLCCTHCTNVRSLTPHHTTPHHTRCCSRPGSFTVMP
jgi:hypothetical protein